MHLDDLVAQAHALQVKLMMDFQELLVCVPKLRQLHSSIFEFGLGRDSRGPASYRLCAPSYYLLDKIGNSLSPLDKLMHLSSRVAVLSRRVIV